MQKKPFLIAAAVAVLLAAAALLVFGRSGPPSDASPEAGFARDMAVHHAQAVEMSFLVYDRSTSPEVRTLAFDIINTQAAQRGMFMGWLQQWGLRQAGDRPPMAWMVGHGHGGTEQRPDAMPGMATKQELDRLRSLKGRDAEILFLQLMIRHHQGGVKMAEAALKLAERPEVVTMARQIVTGQSGEITLMTDYLKQRGAQPLPGS
ncbi:DUF305 domain-containing protein [Thermoactinospora rubra]|uniref:DUF305 domain-containing protein n=1 Tax=Thermoactinospora rubra TaxID=1088767 RepID=UPI000A11BA77|nr:DUF305 domain-containing protein [Thermoactinospora rubra]